MCVGHILFKKNVFFLMNVSLKMLLFLHAYGVNAMWGKITFDANRIHTSHREQQSLQLFRICPHFHSFVFYLHTLHAGRSYVKSRLFIVKWI